MDTVKAQELFKEMIDEALVTVPNTKELSISLKVVELCGFGTPVTGEQNGSTVLQLEKHADFIAFISNLGAYGYAVPHNSKKMLILF